MSDREKKKVMEMYKYKEAFHLRDEIGTCPNIEVEKMSWTNSHFLLDHTT